MRHLSGPERDVLELRLGLAGARRTVDEVSNELGLSKRHVREIEALAYSKLRHPSTAA